MTVLDPGLVSLASAVVDATGAVIRRYFRTPFAVDTKTDDSPVTIADREAEAQARRLITGARPTDGIIGEEHGTERPHAPWVWVIDPIDGTKSFVTGRPIFGTILALLHEGVPVLGIIDQPILGERWVGAQGRTTTFNGQPIRTRPCPAIAQASVAATHPDMFAATDLSRFQRVARSARVSVYGGDCYSYGLLASGHLDLVIESSMKIHDWAGLVPVVQGAGGVMSDWTGAPLTAASTDGRIIAAGDARTHAEALGRLADGDPIA